MTMPATLSEFGKELKKLLGSSDAQNLLHGEEEWGRGGCWTLASAVAEFLGPPAELWAVSETHPGDLEDRVVPVSHVVVRYEDLFIDFSGTQTEKQLIKNLEREGYSEPELKPMTRRLAREAAGYGIPCDVDGANELLRILRRKFGPS